MDNLQLNNIRKKIDSIDIQIHELLMQRSEVVQEILDAKKLVSTKNPVIYQPAREAVVLKNILSRHSGKIPHSVIIHLWRSLLSAFCNMQCDFSLIYYSSDNSIALRDALRYYFSSTISFKKSDSEFIVLNTAVNNHNTIGILPINSIDNKNEWWFNFPRQLKVSGRLPFFYNDPIVNLSNDYMIVSQSNPVKTDKDKSLFTITSNPDTGRISVINCFNELNQQANSISVHDSKDLSHRYHLIEIDGFFEESEVHEFCQNLQNISQEKIHAVNFLGSYPAPINLEDYNNL
jgi:chorismate mutase